MKKINKEQALWSENIGPSPLTGRLNSGFTLFELLVSISIIAILTALASVSFSVAQKKARDSRRMEDIKMIQTAAEQYYSLNNYQYPTTLSAWVVNGQTILEITPKDPKTGVAYSFPDQGGVSYCACATMENTANGNSDVTDCSAFVATGNNFCVKNQQ